jgi:hypothetical protein
LIRSIKSWKKPDVITPLIFTTRAALWGCSLKFEFFRDFHLFLSRQTKVSRVMFKSIRAYINRIRTSLFGRMERMKESSKRMAFERKRKTLRRFLRNGLRVENLEGRALMAVDMNVISSPMAITMNAADDTAVISRLPAATPYPASLFVTTNTLDPDQDPDTEGPEYLSYVRTAGTGTGGVTISDTARDRKSVV